MSDVTEPARTLDPERYDRWFEQPWERSAFTVERDALLDALGRWTDVRCSRWAAAPDGSPQRSNPPGPR